MPLQDIPYRAPSKVDIALLRFDPENPRFTPDSEFDTSNEIEVIKFYYRLADLGELIQSIATSGYLDIEPLIALSEKDTLIVLEGNRRLAALKVLTEPKLASETGILLPPITLGVEGSFRHVSVYRVCQRDDARDFIGFKHINGPHRWDSLAKARFAANWFRKERERGTTLRDIARRMGDRHDTIQRMVAGIYVLDQAESRNLFRVDDRYPGRPFFFTFIHRADSTWIPRIPGPTRRLASRRPCT
jgi:hypothetical protein